MSQIAQEILPVNIEDELKQSYMDYAMSVIVGRALPDVRDGLKPVHRRVLYAMHELNNDWNKGHKKSARIVGEVIGKYHPHGDGPVYDSIVRMAQDFAMRYPLVDGQGNFGSVDGDAPAAMRYTEIRLTKLSHELMADLDKETVDFAPNYDESEFAPKVLPAKIPNLLINGASGIAVGMATNIPPHNLAEVVNACIALIDDPELSFDKLIELVPGPDFPTGAVINGRAGIINAYKTGRGKLYIRAVAEIEELKPGKQAIIVNELPYQINKARLIEKIADLVKSKRIEGITGLRDESDKEGMRIVIEVRRGENAEVVLNNLYAQTKMQYVYGINMVALVDNQPRTLGLRQVLSLFLDHRREVVTRRTIFELRKAKARAHILEGLGVALTNIDPVIALIKACKSPAEAKEKLLAKQWPAGWVSDLIDRAEMTYPEDLEPIYGLKDKEYRLSPLQAQAILDLKLHRLTGLEQEKIRDEYKAILEEIAALYEILHDENRLMAVIREELEEIKLNFSDKRRTQIQASQADLTIEDLIDEQDVVVTLSVDGYIKYQPLDLYQAQRRGGRGKAAAQLKEEDCIHQMLMANTHDQIMCFSSKGKVYWLKVFQLPEASRTSRGKPIINLLPLDADEKITTILPLKDGVENMYIVMATAMGTIKKVQITEFMRPRSTGLIAVDLVEGDSLIGVDTTNGQMDIMLFSDQGKVARFAEDQIRAMGRTARGVRGIRLGDSQRVISMIVVKADGDILTATENGYGKRTPVADYPVKGRGGQGVISIQTSDRNGAVIGAIQVADDDEVMLISSRGTLVRTAANEVSQVGRNTQGVRLINLQKGEQLVEIECIPMVADTGEVIDPDSANDADASS